MQTYKGVGVCPGRIVAAIRQMPSPVLEPADGQTRPQGSTAEEAFESLRSASEAVRASLSARAAQLSGEAQAVLQATALMAADPMLLKTARKFIDSGLSAERAIWQAAEGVASTLLSLGGAMAERARDVFDVRDRLVAQLRGLSAPGIPTSAEPFILLADDLAPADTATLDPSKVLGLVTASGGPQSHTAIIARSLGLPAVVAAAGITRIPAGTEVFIDGAAGLLVTEPGPAEREAASSWSSQASALKAFDGAGRLADGTRIALLANVGNAQEAKAAKAAGAEGIGLFRTEFLFLERDAEPSIEEQTTAYRSVFLAFADPADRPKIVVRTLDAGADKPLPFLSSATEPNPALGVRGYRTQESRPAVLQRQLEAIAAAAREVDVTVWTMAPMIATPAEAKNFSELCGSAGLTNCGVMIEVPAAALSAGKILEHVDFASLGTNDLTQYTMAADRQSAALAALNDSWQPAVLTLIALCTRSAESGSADRGRPIGVCGEAAADPALAVVLVGLGVSTLSMSARAIPAVAAVLKSVSLSQAGELAALALTASSATEAKDLVRERLPILLELGL
ncbi:phosphoenolpyruvate--protein phosphotransferase [Psychromicrobium sp. YIM B11713]|uniref:phosphoenolpyruvate--protein phosphotransferase n=1 Tax=Psychromicrobium sp. YIM B11713 TaxID=3145233 RepID=UPI00374EEE0D